MHHDELAAAEELFRALGNRVRLAVLVKLREGPRCVHELADYLGVRQPLVSQHLRTLRAARLVRAQRHGTEMQYSLADEHVTQLVADAITHTGEARETEEQ